MSYLCNTIYWSVLHVNMYKCVMVTHIYTQCVVSEYGTPNVHTYKVDIDLWWVSGDNSRTTVCTLYCSHVTKYHRTDHRWTDLQFMCVWMASSELGKAVCWLQSTPNSRTYVLYVNQLNNGHLCWICVIMIHIDMQWTSIWWYYNIIGTHGTWRRMNQLWCGSDHPYPRDSCSPICYTINSCWRSMSTRPYAQHSIRWDGPPRGVCIYVVTRTQHMHVYRTEPLLIPGITGSHRPIYTSCMTSTK